MIDRKAQEGGRPVRPAPTAAESAFEDEGGALMISSSPSSGIGAARGRMGERPRGGDSVPVMNAGTSTVRDYMSSNVSPVREDTTLLEAAQQMRISGVGGVPVLDSRGERCVGILTERDVVVRVLAEERDPCAAVVRDAATRQPVMCAPDDDIAIALAQMREAEIQHLPVIARGSVVGVISLADVVFRRPDEERGTIVLPPARSR
jgi:CBS domain-containing protein